MSASFDNPYPKNSAEHHLWHRWHRAFFNEPVHAQFHEIESELRHTITTLSKTGERIESPDLREEMRSAILQLEHTALMLTEAAEHAYMRVVTATGAESNGNAPNP